VDAKLNRGLYENAAAQCTLTIRRARNGRFRT
jgi:hypothetical protein